MHKKKRGKFEPKKKREKENSSRRDVWQKNQNNQAIMDRMALGNAIFFFGIKTSSMARWPRQKHKRIIGAFGRFFFRQTHHTSSTEKGVRGRQRPKRGFGKRKENGKQGQQKSPASVLRGSRQRARWRRTFLLARACRTRRSSSRTSATTRTLATTWTS